MNSNEIENENQFGVAFPQHTWGNHTMPIILGLAAISATRLSGMINESLSTRDLLPEPFDIPDHAGNLGLTFIIADQIAKKAHGTEPIACTEEELARTQKKLAIVLGVVSVAANIFAEKVGYGSTSTPDPIDFAYGLMGGVLAFYARKPNFLDKGTVNTLLEFEEEDRAGYTPGQQNSMALIHSALQKRNGSSQLQTASSAGSPQIARPGRDTPMPSTIKPAGSNLQKRNKTKKNMQKKSKKSNRRK